MNYDQTKQYSAAVHKGSGAPGAVKLKIRHRDHRHGMPILDVDKAQHVIVMKRSMNPGFAGVDNPLFYNEKTMLLFGDAHDSIMKLLGAVKELQ